MSDIRARRNATSMSVTAMCRLWRYQRAAARRVARSALALPAWWYHRVRIVRLSMTNATVRSTAARGPVLGVTSAEVIFRVLDRLFDGPPVGIPAHQVLGGRG